ncbi:porin [Microbulbifer halophilus]|uniref:porin n=1 Tax=Microbulbifer halophilus TaxID=453963 RepID=UPI00360892B6
MKKTAVSLAIAAALPALASADTFTFYGKANVDFQSADEGDGATTDIESNASRLGAKGELPFDSGVKGIYKLEYGVDIDGDSEETLKRRNLYAGWRAVSAR